MRKVVIGVMGPGNEATSKDLENAYELGQLIATAGWVLLTGGRKVGVMDAASRGSTSVGGLTLGILPSNNAEALSDAVDIAIITDMGHARNNINVLSSDVVIACGMGIGTASEVALALKNQKSVILLTDHQEAQQFFVRLSPDKIRVSRSPQEAMQLVRYLLNKNRTK